MRSNSYSYDQAEVKSSMGSLNTCSQKAVSPEPPAMLPHILERLITLIKINADTERSNQMVYEVVFGSDGEDCCGEALDHFSMADHFDSVLSDLERQARDANSLASRLRSRLIGQ